MYMNFLITHTKTIHFLFMEGEVSNAHGMERLSFTWIIKHRH